MYVYHFCERFQCIRRFLCADMCVYLYVYKCVYAYMYVCVPFPRAFLVYQQIPVHRYLCVYACMYVCIHVCMHTCVYVCVSTNASNIMYVCMHTHTHTQILTAASTTNDFLLVGRFSLVEKTCVYMHARARTHTHTHKYSQQLAPQMTSCWLVGFPQSKKHRKRILGPRNEIPRRSLEGNKSNHCLGECTCMYVCMYVCIYVCIYAHTLCENGILQRCLEGSESNNCHGECTCIFVCMYIRMYVCMYVYTYLRRSLGDNTSNRRLELVHPTHVCTNTYIHTCIHTYTDIP